MLGILLLLVDVNIFIYYANNRPAYISQVFTLSLSQSYCSICMIKTDLTGIEACDIKVS